MRRAIVLSVIAVLATAASAVAQDAADAPPPPAVTAEVAPAAPDSPLQAIPAPDKGAKGTRKPAVKPTRPKGKGDTLPRLDPKRDEKAFQGKVALAQSLHTSERCGAAYVMYLELQSQQPDNPDVLWGLGECGATTAGFLKVDLAAAKRQRFLDAQAAYRRYAEVEKRKAFATGKKSRVARARDRASQLDAAIAALPAPPADAVVAATGAPPTAAPPANAPDAREFPKHAETLPLCGMQAFWDPNHGLNPAFAVELFALLHADPEFRVTIWLPSDWNDRSRRLFQSVNDLSLKDQGFRDRYGFKPAVLRDFATYESRVGFVGVAGAEQQLGRVTLHHPNGIDVSVVRCDAARGALAWAVEEKSRQAVANVGTGIRPAERSVAPAIVAAAPPPDALAPVAPPVVVAAAPPADAPAPLPEAGTPPAVAAPDEAVRKEFETIAELLRAKPDDLGVQERWVIIAATHDRCSEAMPVYLRIAEQSKQPAVHLAGSACAEVLKQPREEFLAMERYVRAVKFVGDPSVYFSLADGFATLGDRSRAKHYFERFLLMDPRGEGTPQWIRAKTYLQEFAHARVNCFVQRGVATPALVQAGGRWVVQVRVPANALERAPNCPDPE